MTNPRSTPVAAGSDRLKAVFLFSSQGAQWPGMGRHFYREEPIFRDAILCCDEVVRPNMGWSLLDCFSEGPLDKAVFTSEERIQPAITAMQIALLAMLRGQGIEPGAVAGLSMGELAAAQAAEILTLNDAMRVACAQAISTRRKLPPGRMVFVRLSREKASLLLNECSSRANIAVELSPNMVVISGPESSIDEITALLALRKVRCGLLPMKFAFHSPEVLPLQNSFLAMIQPIDAQSGFLPMYSSVSGRLQSGQSFGPDYWWQIYHRPAQFHAMVDSLLADGYEAFIEIGPHPTLLTAVSDIASRRTKTVLTTCVMNRDEDERVSWQESLKILRPHADFVAMDQLR